MRAPLRPIATALFDDLADNARMPFVDDDACELNLKIVYHGPGLAGKTTNLGYVHEHADPVTRSKLVSVATETERTLVFNFVPSGLARCATTPFAFTSARCRAPSSTTRRGSTC